MVDVGPEHFKEVKQLSRPDILFRICKESNTDQVFIGSSTAQVYAVDPLATEPVFTEFSGHSSYVMGLVDTGTHLISAGYDRSMIWCKKETRALIRREENAHDRWIRNLTVSPDQKTVISVGDDMVCKLWDAQTGEEIRTLKGHQLVTENHFPNMLYAAAVSPNGKWIATVDRIAKIKIWDFQTGQEVKEFEAPKCYTWDPKQRIHSIGGIRSVTFSPDSKSVAVGGIGQIGNIDHLDAPGRVEIFEIESGVKTHEFEGDDKFKGLVEQIVFHPSGRWLIAVGGKDKGWIQFLDLEKKETLRQENVPMHVHQISVTDDFSTIYAAGHGKLVVWSLTRSD